MDLDDIPKEEEFLLKGHVCNRQEFFDQGGFEEMAGTDLLKVYYNKSLGRGNFNSVYMGKFKGKWVAVKEMILNPSDREIIQQKMEKLKKLEHDNVLKLWDVLFLHVRIRSSILEICAGTIEDFCENKYEGPMPPDDVVFLQTVSGVEYIHSQNLIHGDIKPSNVLISLSNPVQIKVSELTFERKKIGDILNLSETKHMPFWMATESLEQSDSSCEQQQDETTATDTFSTGCVLFYFATRGTHPFGNNLIYTAVNILKSNPVELISLKKKADFRDDDRVLYDLIEGMLRKKEDRIALSYVKKRLSNLISAKLTFDLPDDKIAVEYAVCQSVMPEKRESLGEWSVGSNEDLK